MQIIILILSLLFSFYAHADNSFSECQQYKNEAKQVIEKSSRTVSYTAIKSCIADKANSTLIYKLNEKINYPAGAAWAISAISGKDVTDAGTANERKPLGYFYAGLLFVFFCLSVYTFLQSKIEHLIQEAENVEQTFLPLFVLLLFVFVFLPFNDNGESIATFLIAAAEGASLYLLLLALLSYVPIFTSYFTVSDYSNDFSNSTKEKALYKANVSVNQFIKIKTAERISKNKDIQNNAFVDKNGQITVASVQKTLDCYSVANGFSVTNNQLVTPFSKSNSSCYQASVDTAYVQKFGYTPSSAELNKFWIDNEKEFESIVEDNAAFVCSSSSGNSNDKAERNYQCIDYEKNIAKSSGKYVSYFNSAKSIAEINSRKKALVEKYIDYTQKIDSEKKNSNLADSITRNIFGGLTISIMTSYFEATKNNINPSELIENIRKNRPVFLGFEDKRASNSFYILTKSNTSSQNIFIPAEQKEFFAQSDTLIYSNPVSNFNLLPSNGPECRESFSKCEGLKPSSLGQFQKDMSVQLTDSLMTYAVLKILEKSKSANNQALSMTLSFLEFIIGILIAFLGLTFFLQLFALTVHLLAYASTALLFGLYAGILILRGVTALIFKSRDDSSFTNARMLTLILLLKPCMYVFVYTIIFMIGISSLSLLFIAFDLKNMSIQNAIMEMDFETIRNYLLIAITGSLTFVLPALTAKSLTNWIISQFALADSFDSEDEYEKTLKEKTGTIQRFIFKLL